MSQKYAVLRLYALGAAPVAAELPVVCQRN